MALTLFGALPTASLNHARNEKSPNGPHANFSDRQLLFGQTNSVSGR